MGIRMFKTILSHILAIIITCMTAGVSTADYREEYHENYPVTPGISVEIENVNGNVEISSWDSETVEIHAVKKTSKSWRELDRLRIDVTVNGVMTIKTVKDDFMDGGDEDETFFDRLFGRGIGHGWPKVTVDFTIKVPRTVNLTLAKTTNGNVRLVGTSGDTEAKSTNGNVRIDGTEGVLTAHTTNGNISIEDAQVLSAKSTNGSIKIREGSLIGNAKTTNGSIDAEIGDTLSGDVDISTVNGSVDVYLDPDMDADLDLRSSNGKIVADGFKITVSAISKKNVAGELGNGGYLLNVKTVNGSIRLHRK